MFTSNFAAAMMVGTALATSLTTIEPCTQSKGLYPDVTITEQFQPVSFCVPTSTLKDGKYATSYPLASTSVYVSTVIPCGWDGKSASTCTVTKTDQDVMCSQTATTITSVTPIITAAPQHNGTHSNSTSYSTWYETVSKRYNAPFNSLGGLAIPGYAGSGLCKSCDAQADGSRVQNVNVTECSKINGGAPKCAVYAASWVSKVAPSTTSVAQAACATKTSVPSAGTYTFTFPQSAPGTTFAVPAKGGSPASIVTAAPQPWFAYVTRSCNGPTTFDFATTVTKTITFYVPYETKTPSGSSSVSIPVPTGWGAWPAAASSGSSTTPASSDPSTGAQTGSWGDWASATSSGTTSSASETGTWGNWESATSTGTTSSASTTYETTSAETTTSAASTTSMVTSTSEMTTTSSAITTSMVTSTSEMTTTSAETTTSMGTSTSEMTTTSAETTTSMGTSTSQMTTSSSTTSGGDAVPTNEFRILVEDLSQARFKKRALRYVGFAGDDASVVGDSAAALFNFQGRDLKTGSDFISTEGSSAFAPLERTPVVQTSGKYFNVAVDGVVTLDGAAGFCVLGDAILIVFSTAPAGCVPSRLVKEGSPMGSTTTTTSTSSTSTTSMPISTTSISSTTSIPFIPTTTLSTVTTTSSVVFFTTTTTSADISADVDIPDPTPVLGSLHVARHKRAAIRRIN